MRFSKLPFMNSSVNIFLIGLPGAGKSSVGRELADLMGRDFYDTDHVIEDRTGVEIAWIFDREGEEGFRARETLILRELADQSNLVIATGGGTILKEENRRIMSEKGIVVYLQVGLDQQFHRVEKNQQTRPLLRVDNIKERLVDFAETRTSLYEALADHSFKTDRRAVKRLARQIIVELEQAE